MKLNFPGRVLLTLCVLMQVGCAAEVVLSRWGKSDIVVDGMENEWEGPPQYYEKEKQMVVRVANDAKSLYLCLSTRNAGLTRQLLGNGWTVWLDPRGSKERVFGVNIFRLEPAMPGGGVRPEAGPLPRPNGHGRPVESEKQVPPLAKIDSLEITFENATGPLQMGIDEARRFGIDAAMGRRLADGSMVCEFRFDFCDHTSLLGLRPGSVLGIGILSGAADKEGPGSRPFGTGMGFGGGPGGGGLGGEPSGGMGGGPRGAPPGRNKPLEIWLRVKMADSMIGAESIPAKRISNQ